MLPTIHQYLCEIVLVKRVNNIIKFASCADRTVRQKHKLALLYFIYVDFRMLVALTSSTVHDIKFTGFQYY